MQWEPPFPKNGCRNCQGTEFYGKMGGLLCKKCSRFMSYYEIEKLNKEVQNEVLSSGANVRNPEI